MDTPNLQTPLRVVAARPEDLGRFLDVLEELADWLAERGIRQWPRGQFRAAADYYAGSIARHEAVLDVRHGSHLDGV